jgi:hypothetical protein
VDRNNYGGRHGNILSLMTYVTYALISLPVNLLVVAMHPAGAWDTIGKVMTGVCLGLLSAGLIERFGV